MSDNDVIEQLSAVFIEFMTPNEAGEPLLLIKDLKPALEKLGVSPQLAELLHTELDHESGAITFEQFCDVYQDKLKGENFTSNKLSESSDDMGGFVPDEFDDFEDSDESYVDEISDNSGSKETTRQLRSDEQNTCEEIFSHLKGSGGRITPKSLRRIARKLKFDVAQRDLEKMVELASTREEFEQLWLHLK